MAYRFSVGNIALVQSGVTKKSIAQATDVTVDHVINTHKEYGAEGTVVKETVETEEVTFTCSFVESAYDTTLQVGQYYDILLTYGGPGGNTGLSLTLANCRITGYRVTSRQGEFVTSELTFSKSGDIDDAPGSTPTLQTVKFGPGNATDIYIGDNASLDVSFDGNVIDFIIPTALGVGIRATSEMGGGKLSIKVNAYVEKTHHLEVEQYLINLFSTLRTSTGTLTVTYGTTTYTITSAAFVRGSVSGGSGKYANFSCEFVRTAY